MRRLNQRHDSVVLRWKTLRSQAPLRGSRLDDYVARPHRPGGRERHRKIHADENFRRDRDARLPVSYTHLERSIPLPGAEPFDTDRFVAVGQQVMEKIAEAGNCVIVGRGAPYFLRQRADAFHVFLYAPHAEKLRRLLRLGKSQKEAEELLDTIDRDRITFVKRYFCLLYTSRCV